jgi:hypothetical protein
MKLSAGVGPRNEIDHPAGVCAGRKIGDAEGAIGNKGLAAVVVISRSIIGEAFDSFVISG